MAEHLSVEELVGILRECAGEDGQNLDGDVSDQHFADLGYDSLALLETAGRIRRTLGVDVPDDVLGELVTPAQFTAYVNARKDGTA